VTAVFLSAYSPVVVAADSETRFVTRHQSQREIFIELRQHINNGDLATAQSKRAHLQGYPLHSYFDYLLLRKRIQSSQRPVNLLKQLAAFEKNHSEQRLHRKLLGGLKNRAAKLDQWADYARIASQSNAPAHACDDLYARVHNRQSAPWNTATRELWVDYRRHTENCDKAFATLIKRVGDVPTKALWQRTVALLMAGKKDQVGNLLPFYNRRDRKTVQSWLDGIDTPGVLLQSPSMRGKSEHHRKFSQHLLRRWRRDDLVAATEFWKLNGTRFGFRASDVAGTVSRHAVLAAKRREPAASVLLETAPVNRDVQHWNIRVAMREGKWKTSLDFMDLLSAQEQQSARWQYWRARALAELGDRSAANRIYKGLSDDFDYYGFLAADRLAAGYSISAGVAKLDQSELNTLFESAQFARAIEFHLVRISWEGRREWNRFMDGASPARAVAAAHVARAVDWPDRIHASVKAAAGGALYDGLFPTPHRALANTLATDHQVPLALIYGIMKQESGFIPDIKSSAGAIGLMQLMPATAAEVASKIGVSAPTWRLTDGALNVRLGTRYLSNMLTRFDQNTALAAAAYNAGPHRVTRWLAKGAMPTDVWVETIPFDETRRYVKAVLFNTAVKQWQLNNGSMIRLRHLMPDIVPLG